MSKPHLVAISAIMLACSTFGCSDPPASQEPVAIVEERLLEAFATADEVAVIVNFRDPVAANLSADPAGYRRALRHVRESLLKVSLGGFVPTRQFEHVPAMAGRISRAALEALSRDPNVSFIQIDGLGHGALSVSVPAIGADVAKTEFHVTGKGVRVAVLDTGANSTHPDLKNSIIPTQHCFTQRACPPANSAEGTSAEDDHGHGSHVSGIVTSDGSIAGLGFAPDAEIVAVKINDRNDAGMVSDWVAGLDWVYGNLSTLNVKIVNMSICTDRLYSSLTECDAGEPALRRSVKNLGDAGVTLFAASGNNGSSSQVAAPACIGGVIAVGATYKSNQGRQPSSGTFSAQFGATFGNCADTTTAFDKVACFTNSSERLDLVAPGAVITSDSLGTRTQQYWGTSQASPSAAGVAALMLQCNPRLAPAQVKDILVRTGASVTDPKNGRTFPSIRAAAAVKEACSAGAGGSTGGAASNGGQNSGGSGTGGVPTTRGGAGGSVPSTGGTGTGGGVTVGGRNGNGGAITTTGGSNATGGSSAATGGSSGLGGNVNSTGGRNETGGSAEGGVGGAEATIGGGGSALGGAPGSGGLAGTGGLPNGLGGATSATTAVTMNGLPSSGANGLVAPMGSSVADENACGCRAAGRSTQSRSTAFVGFVTLLGLALALSRRQRPRR